MNFCKEQNFAWDWNLACLCLFMLGTIFCLYKMWWDINPVAFISKWYYTKLKMDWGNRSASKIRPAFVILIYYKRKKNQSRVLENVKLFLIVLTSNPLPLLTHFFLSWHCSLTPVPPTEMPGIPNSQHVMWCHQEGWHSRAYGRLQMGFKGQLAQNVSCLEAPLACGEGQFFVVSHTWWNVGHCKITRIAC